MVHCFIGSKYTVYMKNQDITILKSIIQSPMYMFFIKVSRHIFCNLISSETDYSITYKARHISIKLGTNLNNPSLDISQSKFDSMHLSVSSEKSEWKSWMREAID